MSSEWQAKRRVLILSEQERWNMINSEVYQRRMRALIPAYFQPTSSIRAFNRVFQLPAHLYKRCKDRVRLWPSKKFAKEPPPRREDPIHEDIIKRLINADVCEPTVAGPYVSKMFYLATSSSLRPIFNYGHMPKLFETPRFNLPSLYQVVDRYNWES